LAARFIPRGYSLYRVKWGMWQEASGQ